MTTSILFIGYGNAQLVGAAVVGKNQIVLAAYPVNLSYHNNPPMGAASSRDHLISRLKAAPTDNITCSFKITGLCHSMIGAFRTSIL